MKNHNGKEYLKNNAHICVTESLCYTAEINTSIKKKSWGIKRVISLLTKSF